MLLRELLPDIVFTKTLKTDAQPSILNPQPLTLGEADTSTLNPQHSTFYYNCMAKATTSLPLTELQQRLKDIETTMGDSHESHLKGIVVIDIDLLAFGSQQLKADDWQRPYIKELVAGL